MHRKNSATLSRTRRPQRRGRAGSRLTQEQKRLIVAAIEAGTTDYVAAEAAGISPRTFRELRQRAEGRHPTRRSTPDLRTFFRQVDESVARARMRREIEIAEKDAKHWLKYRARSKPGLEGWSEPVPEEGVGEEPVPTLTKDELQQVVSSLVASGAVPLPSCGDPSCVCNCHPKRPGGGADEE